MTRDRDFKDIVRKRAAKTGESYQAARGQLKRPAPVVARVKAIFRTQDPPDGLAFGCVVETGRIARGMGVALFIGDAEVHRGTVASLRVAKYNIDTISEGEGPFGLMIDPPYDGRMPEFVTASADTR
jgi:translation initiation factor IF-2